MSERARNDAPLVRAIEGPRRGERQRRLLAHLRRLTQLAIVAFLGWRIAQVGWRQVVASLPREPAFYLLALALYLALPASELVGYRQLFRFPAGRGFLTFLRKRVYNKEVIGYSGEVLLYLWVRDEVGVGSGPAFAAVKASNILSTLAATVWALGWLAAVLLTGALPLVADRLPGASHYLLVAALVVAAATLVLVRFRQRLLAVPLRVALGLGAVHLGRLAAVNGLRIAQWAVVMPAVPFATWAGLLALEILLTRLPLLPGKDLVFAGAMFDLAPRFGLEPTAMVAMLIAQSAVERLLNLVVFLVAWLTPAAAVVRGEPRPRARGGEAA